MTASRVEQLRLEGNKAFARGDWEDAVRTYTIAVDLLTDDKRVYSNRSAARLKMAEKLTGHERSMLLSAALTDAEQAIELDPEWAKGYYRKGLALEGLGQEELAINAYVKGLKISPSDAEQLLGASEVLQAFAQNHMEKKSTQEIRKSPGNSNSAATAAGATAAAESDEASTLRNEGNAAFKMQDYDQAIRSYTEALNLLRAEGHELDKRIFSNRSAAYLAKAEETESTLTYTYALEDAQMCINLDPNWPKSWYRLGLALAGNGKIDEAIEKLREGLEKCPNDPDLERELEELLQAKRGDKRGRGNGVKAGPSSASSSRPIDGADAEKKQRTGAVVDMKLYNTLGVKAVATQAEIKKAYLLLAKETHPDKNKNDPSATEKFQAIGRAYQVLSNPETRDAYDKFGMKALENVDMEDVDPAELFAMLFGSDRFDRYLGELQLTSMVSRLDEEGNAPSDQTLEKIQEERVSDLVHHLVAMLGSYVNGHHKEFLEWCRREAAELKETNFGKPMLYVVGQAYVRHANIAMGKQQFLGLPGYWRQLSNSKAKFGTKWNATASAIRMMTQQKQLDEEVKKAEKEGRGISEEDQAKFATNIAAGCLDVVWKRTIMDIVYTLDEVCHKVLSGKDLPVEETSEGGGSFRKKRSSGAFDWKNPLSAASNLFSNGPEIPAEGVAARGRTQILHTRAAALKQLGKIFMENGSMDLSDELKAAYAQESEAGQANGEPGQEQRGTAGGNGSLS